MYETTQRVVVGNKAVVKEKLRNLPGFKQHTENLGYVITKLICCRNYFHLPLLLFQFPANISKLE